MNPSVVIVLIWLLAATLVARLIVMPGKTSSGRPDIATSVLMPLAVIGQAALSSWLVARVGDASILIAIVQVAVASAFWQLINDSSGESRFQPLGVILPMLLLVWSGSGPDHRHSKFVPARGDVAGFHWKVSKILSGGTYGIARTSCNFTESKPQ